MRKLILIPLLGALAVAPAPAAAAVAHTVIPGETLWSIAVASNLTTHALAVYNGLPDDAPVILGSTVEVPSVAEAAAALSAAPAAAAPGTTSAPAATASAAAPPALGAYVVQPGDTLSAIAARSGVATEQVAAMNGLDPAGVLLSGTALKLPTGAPAPAPGTQPAPTVVPDAAPQATPVRLDSGTIGQIAAEEGVPGDLAAAVAWQESGFNNDFVSPANARGIMQLLPGTWDWVQGNLAGAPLDPNSAADNVRAGVLYLGHLLQANGGDPAAAVAAYYQGQGALEDYGVLPETQRYVADVLALRGRFGG